MAHFRIHLSSGEVVECPNVKEEDVWYGEHGVFWRIDAQSREASFFPYANVLRVHRNPKRGPKV